MQLKREEEMTVGELVAEKPMRSRVFEQMGIDFCCGGKRPLEEACREKGLDIRAVTKILHDFDASSECADTTDWREVSLVELCDNIERTHHAYLKGELPVLSALLQKVCKVHGEHHPELKSVEAIFEEFQAELSAHMGKEECVLFPYIRKLEQTLAVPAFHCGSISSPISVMEAEHEHAGAALAAMRSLLNNYVVPDGACNSYRALLERLNALERDMHIHVHKENNILFPKAIAKASGPGA